LVDALQKVVARYLYDPFGNTLAVSGPMAEANLYRFSSKEWLPAVGLVYYLYRFYDPNLHRWPNRDPIGEWGGLNLHLFNRNSPIGLFDSFGLDYFASTFVGPLQQEDKRIDAPGLYDTEPEAELAMRDQVFQLTLDTGWEWGGWTRWDEDFGMYTY